MAETESIKECFAGKTIFITGGSGFIGKGLIEKLLRSCPEIQKIYILLRPKKGKDLRDRLEQIVSSPLFDLLKSKNIDFAKKLVAVNGDVSELGLGLSKADRKLLTDEVQIFFNAAASVKFDDFLKDSIFTNLRGVREAGTLALNMKNIEVFVHVSTTYCNIDNRKVINEILYPSPGDWREAIFVAENYDKNKFDVMSQKYIGVFPNTYTFTKRLAEHCINDLLVGKVRTIICRPSVVIASVHEPFKGYIDNFNGPIGLLVAAATGLLRISYGDQDIDTDYNALDNVIKCMIVSAWHKVHFGNLNELSIYHLSKSGSTPYTIRKFIKNAKQLVLDIPFETKIWFPNSRVTICWYDYYACVMLFHMIPTFFLDLMLRVVGRKPMAFKIQRKIYIANMALSHFMLNEWKFINQNTLKLFDDLPDKEKEDFNFLIFPVDDNVLYDYFANATNFARIYLLKETKEITQANITNTKTLYYLDRALKTIFIVVAAWLFFVRTNVPVISWYKIHDYWISL